MGLSSLPPPEAIDFGARSDTGRVRATNEDRFLAAPPLFIVADGMGGHQAGEVAAAMAVDLIRAALDGARPVPEGNLRAAVEEANRSLHGAARDRPDLEGMGTTCTVAVLDGATLHLAHVGDSRAYRLREGRLAQLTVDHTLVEALVREGVLSDAQARTDERGHIVTRALGVAPDVEVDLASVALEPGDRFLLCSDGLSGEVEDPTIAEVLAGEADPRRAAGRLVELANAAGGRDNVTVIVIDAGRPVAAPAVLERPPRPTDRRRGALGTAILLATLAAVVLVFLGPLGQAPGPAPTMTGTPSSSPSPSIELQPVR